MKKEIDGFAYEQIDTEMETFNTLEDMGLTEADIEFLEDTTDPIGCRLKVYQVKGTKTKITFSEAGFYTE